ncbi:nucleoside triphosphate pyrophosphohydrolase [Hirschia maritima]|uniref:nucleoside triphosphate pyrophosphohydrolase n=1 Tax=Hirschia maritima TaxID=1121961 RepID=UPI00036BF4F9|nr:nucleoside triphosphate pyrophosphohydrolase [Hirschia maritima]
MTKKTRAFVETENAITDLIHIMERLRDKETGCPWDIEQTFETIAPYTIEEAYEVAEAIHLGDMCELRDELGDLFLQVVFQSQIAKDNGIFDIHDVARAIVSKMIARHPHVFGDAEIKTADDQTSHWEALKEKERAAKARSEKLPSALDGVAYALPSLTRSEKLLKRAARTGFDWPKAEDIKSKLDEELVELEDAVASGIQEDINEEMGDVLLVVANLARKHGVDPETALRAANDKFTARFEGMEQLARSSGNEFNSLSLEQQSDLWLQVKSKLK